MPSCKETVKILQGEELVEFAIIIRCIDGNVHEGRHQGHVWVLGKNNATGKNGHYSTIWWDTPEYEEKNRKIDAC